MLERPSKKFTKISELRVTSENYVEPKIEGFNRLHEIETSHYKYSKIATDSKNYLIL